MGIKGDQYGMHKIFFFKNKLRTKNGGSFSFKKRGQKRKEKSRKIFQEGNFYSFNFYRQLFKSDVEKKLENDAKSRERKKSTQIRLLLPGLGTTAKLVCSPLKLSPKMKGKSQNKWNLCQQSSGSSLPVRTCILTPVGPI